MAQVQKGAEAQVRDSGADDQRWRNWAPVTDAAGADSRHLWRNCSPMAQVQQGAEAQMRDSGAGEQRWRSWTPVTDATEDQAVTPLSQVNRNGAGAQPRPN